MSPALKVFWFYDISLPNIAFRRTSFTNFFYWTKWTIPQGTVLVGTVKVLVKTIFSLQRLKELILTTLAAFILASHTNPLLVFYSLFDLAFLSLFSRFALWVFDNFSLGYGIKLNVDAFGNSNSGRVRSYRAKHGVFPSLVFHLTNLLSKHRAVCVRPPGTWKDFTALRLSSLRITIREQMIFICFFSQLILHVRQSWKLKNEETVVLLQYKMVLVA